MTLADYALAAFALLTGGRSTRREQITSPQSSAQSIAAQADAPRNVPPLWCESPSARVIEEMIRQGGLS
jgi:hypothetical protein